jgi:hypothetical protein
VVTASHRSQPDGRLRYAEVETGSAVIMLSDESPLWVSGHRTLLAAHRSPELWRILARTEATTATREIAGRIADPLPGQGRPYETVVEPARKWRLITVARPQLR